MVLSRIGQQSITTLTSLTRRKLGDPDTDPAGQAIPPALRRWSDAAIQATLNEVLSEMATASLILTLGEALLFSDLAYTESASRDGNRLPAAVGAEGVFLVQDVTSPTFPLTVPWVPSAEIDHYQNPTGVPTGQSTWRFYTIISDADPTAVPPYRIKIRPEGTGRTYRIWYVAAPLVTGAASDLSPISGRWTQHIATATAVRLISIDDEVPEALAAIHANLWQQYLDFATKPRGPERITLTRIRSC